MIDNELTHHGVVGMKWGVRRTPAQLGHRPTGKKRKKGPGLIKKASKKIKEETEEMKQKRIESKKQAVLKSRSAAELYKHADLFSTQELQTAYNRLNLENNIKNLEPAKVKRGKEFLKDTADNTRSVANAINEGSKIYNNIAAIYEAFNKNGKTLPKINLKNDDNDNGGNKKKNNNNSNNNNSNNTNAKNNSGNTGTKSSTQKESKQTIFGDGNGTVGSSSKRKETVIEAEWSWVSKDNMSKGVDYVSNSLDRALSDRSVNKVSGLLSDGNVSSGRDFVAGLLPAGRDD